MFWRPWRSDAKPKRLREGLTPSPNEERYLLAETLTGRVYIVPSATRIFGPMDVALVQALLQATCDRHEARRTGFEPKRGGGFSKYVEDRATVELKQVSMPGATREEIRQAVNDYCYQRGDFSPATLHRFMIIKLAEEEHVFVSAMHHATSDGVTEQAFWVEVVSRLFGGEVSEAPPQYSDFWDWDWASSDAYKTAEAFWTGRLGGLSDVGAWPEDRAGGSGERARLGVSVILAPELVAATQAAAQQIGVTHFSYFYAVYLVLLARMTGSQTVCTTFQSAGRRGKDRAEGAHGVFSNALILATRVDEAESISTLSARLRTEVREAIAHEIFPYHHVIRATGIHPRYAINWYPQMAAMNLGDLQFEPLRFDENQDDDDLNLRFVTYGDQTELFTFYNPDAFSRERVQAATEQLAALAGELARDVNRPIGDAVSAALAPPGLLPDPMASLPDGGGEAIYGQFLARAAEAPEAIAIVQGERAWTYSEVEARSRALAQHLRAQGLAAGDRVAILADRGPELVWSLLAVARMGGVFALLDGAYPQARLARFMQIAAPKAIVHAGAAALAQVAGALAAGHDVAVLDAAAPDAEATGEGLDAADPDAPAYILFTSGSTGGPKGVAASHRPLSHFVAWQASTFGLGAADRFTLLSGLSHDPLLRDVFTPLSIGAAILIPEASTITEPGALAPWFRKARATVTHLTPAMGQLLVAGAARSLRLTDLRHVFWGGDRLTPERVSELAHIAPNVSQTNFYGATETPQAAAWFPIGDDANAATVPVGVGTEGFQLLVVDAARQPVGVGELGEIAVRSNYLSLGYVQAGRIAPDEDRGVDPEGRRSIYYTGDRGIYLPDGAVLMVGRADDQVKVRGHRVELSEATTALLAHAAVTSAIALAVGEGGSQRIVAFVQAARRGLVSEAELRSFLAERLPAYMLPQRIRLVDEMPWLPNGKIDRQALRALPEADSGPRAPVAAKTATERALIAAWSKVLGLDSISADASFAELGGDSLSYVQVYLATEEVLGVAPTGWHVMSVSDLAAARRQANPFWSMIDMPIVLRATAIVLVVAGHFSVAKHVGAASNGGATSALMIVSGFMFGSLPLREVFATETAKPVLRTLRNILLPTVALSLLIWLFRTHGRPPEAYILLFTADLQRYGAVRGLAQDLYLWYVHCLLHIFLLFFGAILLLTRFDGFKIGVRRFLYILFAAACAGRFLLPQLIDPGFFFRGARPLSQIFFLPTTHLATVVLGALVATAATRDEKLRMLPVVALYSGVSWWLFGPGHAGFILASSLLLLGLPRLSLPRVVSGAVFALAGASLWIYLTHMLLRDALRSLGYTPPGLGIVLALVGGVAFWTAWNRGAGLVRQWTRRPAHELADATV
jgi:amino acid adenylation domain-containing protein